MNSCDMCIEFTIDGAHNFLRMRMCIQFVIQVPKQKNAHVSFPVGMVVALNFESHFLSYSGPPRS